MNIYVCCAIVQNNLDSSINTATYSTLAKSSAEAIGIYVKWVVDSFPNSHLFSNPAAHKIPQEMIDAVNPKEANDPCPKQS